MAREREGEGEMKAIAVVMSYVLVILIPTILIFIIRDYKESKEEKGK